MLGVSGAHPLGNKILDPQSDKLLPRISEHRFRLSIDEDNAALVADDHEAIWSRSNTSRNTSS